MPNPDIIGWIATAFLAGKVVPQLHKSFKKGNAKGISRLFLWLWLVGQSFMLWYLLLEPVPAYPLISYVSFNLVAIVIILRYRYFPRKEEDKEEIELSDDEMQLE